MATADAGGVSRYVVGRIDQTTIRLVARVTLMITPNLSIQYYGQPFGTSGKYSNFKSITNASASDYKQRFAMIEASALSLANSVYSVNDGNGNLPYSFSNPDFNIGQFRSNMVIRWEYIPGSTLFLVWTRERNGAFYDSDPNHRNYSFDFPQQGHNVFLMKFTYRFRL